MTTETQIETAVHADAEPKPKKKPSFYIFVRDAGGKSTPIGAAFLHGKGKGMNILIGQDRFEAYPPKT